MCETFVVGTSSTATNSRIVFTRTTVDVSIFDDEGTVYIKRNAAIYSAKFKRASKGNN